MLYFKKIFLKTLKMALWKCVVVYCTIHVSDFVIDLFGNEHLGGELDLEVLRRG
jgi:hypothetical protein